ncbi:hypothetical protein [Variovorax sp. J31P179]|uniref:hypothetical protein n=1 Tax=Variovorax sp. J31P179 TaxID=3053508 RepID=UPI0025764970|nr:hypothetical protein [Variovorax sp. J31P179]
MSSIAHELAALLSTVRTPGDFYAVGTTELLLPRLEVNGVGPIALPLLPTQAEQLIAVAEHAPYGRGRQTLPGASGQTLAASSLSVCAERMTLQLSRTPIGPRVARQARSAAHASQDRSRRSEA